MQKNGSNNFDEFVNEDQVNFKKDINAGKGLLKTPNFLKLEITHVEDMLMLEKAFWRKLMLGGSSS